VRNVAGLQRDQSGKFLNARFQFLRDAQQGSAALTRWHPAPARKRSCRCLNRAIDVGRTAARYFSDLLALRWILHVQDAA